MNQIAALEDVTTDEELIGDPPIGTKKSEFMRPAYSFKGVELFPFTYGYELLFNQVRDAEDTGLFTWLAFVFILSRRGSETTEDHRKWMIGIAWKVASFREALIEWMDTIGPFTNEDKLEAKRIYEESMKAAIATSVEVVPDKGMRTQKNTPPEAALVIYVLRKELGCSRDEVLWSMPLPELNMMFHSFYHMEGRTVRRPKERAERQGKFRRLMSLMTKPK